MRLPDQVEWREIVGFEGLYAVSSMGEVKSLEKTVNNNGGSQHRREKILSQNKRTNGYNLVVLCKEGKTYPRLVHRLVAEAFLENPEGKKVVDHIDTDRNNNRVSNLRWATIKENANNIITRRHLSEAKIGHPYWGRPLTDEEKEKISVAKKGKKLTAEHRKKLSDSHKGNKLTQEQIDKISLANTGKKRSAESRMKMSEAMKGKHKGKHWKIEGGKRVWF